MKTSLASIDSDTQIQKWTEVADWMALAESGLSEDDHEDEPTVSLIAHKFAITKREALQIVCNPKFAEHYHSMRKAIAKVEFDRGAWTRLQRIVKTGSDRDAINAVKEAAALLGYKDSTPLVQLNFSFDQLIRRAAQQGEVIDAEIVEEYPGF